MKSRAQPAILLVTTNWWPLSARLAIALVRHGCAVSALCPPGHPLRHIRGLRAIYTYKGLSAQARLTRAIEEAHPDAVVPCDDRAVWQLHELHAAKPSLRPLIERSLGDPEGYATVRSRDQLLGVAKDIGVRVPDTHRVACEADISRWYSQHAPDAAVKLDGTWGGMGVEIVHSAQEAWAALQRLSRPVGIVKALKRFLIDHDPLALWTWHRQKKPIVTIQEYIAGTPANTMVFCWQGEILAQISVEVLCAQGSTGAATVVRLVKREDFCRAARLLAGRLGLSGFFGLDFMLDQKDGTAYLIEMNPRSTQLGHLELPEQGSLAGVAYAQLAGEPLPQPHTPIKSSTIAFFPQALEWNPKSDYLRRGYHDVPWEELSLVRQLLLKPWPERQWPSRLYRRFWPAARLEAVEFHTATLYPSLDLSPRSEVTATVAPSRS